MRSARRSTLTRDVPPCAENCSVRSLTRYIVMIRLSYLHLQCSKTLSQTIPIHRVIGGNIMSTYRETLISSQEFIKRKRVSGRESNTLRDKLRRLWRKNRGNPGKLTMRSSGAQAPFVTMDLFDAMTIEFRIELRPLLSNRCDVGHSEVRRLIAYHQGVLTPCAQSRLADRSKRR